jgi:hypothetical protein
MGVNRSPEDVPGPEESAYFFFFAAFFLVPFFFAAFFLAAILESPPHELLRAAKADVALAGDNPAGRFAPGRHSRIASSALRGLARMDKHSACHARTHERVAHHARWAPTKSARDTPRARRRCQIRGE